MFDQATASGKLPLKRHRALQPLSREHMGGLIQARNLQRASRCERSQRRQAVEEFVNVWRAEIEHHFDDEERLLLPLCHDEALRERLVAEHHVLRGLAAQCLDDADAVADDADLMHRLGELLRDHIRWEERIFFEAVQRDHPDALMDLLHEADAIEAARPASRANHRPERGITDQNIEQRERKR